ncbi:MAG: ACT domain-containing protein [Candidatus Hodarchaeaceae archaeon]|nr:ACT domain-containing protein [Candidatus Hodarchaeaceae archaeon]
MLVRIEMELEDVPGQLVKVLDPISRFGGNIQNVVHQRDRKTPLGRVPVTVIFDVDERARLNRIIAALRNMGIRITRIGEREGMVKSIVLMIGHIIHTDIRDTIDRVNVIRGVMVSDLSLAMGAVGEESAARATIMASDEKRARAALSRLEKIAGEKKLLMITSLEGM